MVAREIEFELCDGQDDPTPVQTLVEYRSYSLSELQKLVSGSVSEFDGLVLEKLPACRHLAGHQEQVLEVVEFCALTSGADGSVDQNEAPLTREEMLVEIDKRGYRPAVYEELIAYLRSDSRTSVSGDRHLILLALGSFIVMQGTLLVPGRSEPHRTLVRSLSLFDVDGRDSGWLARCLVVRK